jgi:hypothetical protein
VKIRLIACFSINLTIRLVLIKIIHIILRVISHENPEQSSRIPLQNLISMCPDTVLNYRRANIWHCIFCIVINNICANHDLRVLLRPPPVKIRKTGGLRKNLTSGRRVSTLPLPDTELVEGCSISGASCLKISAKTATDNEQLVQSIYDKKVQCWEKS